MELGFIVPMIRDIGDAMAHGGGDQRGKGYARNSVRADPEAWLPLFIDGYEELSKIAENIGIKVVVVGAGAYALHIETDPTKDIDFALSKPIPIEKLVEIYRGLSDRLRGRGWRVLGGRIQAGRAVEDWVVQLFIAAIPGSIVGIKVFNLLAMRPLALYEVEEIYYRGRRYITLTKESWIASKLADPNGIDSRNLARLERVVENGIDKVKLYQILTNLSLYEIVRINARDALQRTNNPELKRILIPLA